MKKLLLGILTTLAGYLHAGAQNAKTEVLLLGCFHFDNPGLDVAKFENANVLSVQRQQEIALVLEKLRQFKPDKIFVEVPAERQLQLDSSYTQYRAGQKTLGASETHQLGFRLGQMLGHPKLYAVDFRETEFPFDSLMKSAMEANQQQLLGSIRQVIDSVQTEFNRRLTSQTITELLLWQNDRRGMDAQVGWYFDMLSAGKEGNHVGSYLTSEWWRRNMVIYENILKKMQGKEERILVIFGSGHTALLDAMMRYNRNLSLTELSSVLR